MQCRDVKLSFRPKMVLCPAQSLKIIRPNSYRNSYFVICSSRILHFFAKHFLGLSSSIWISFKIAVPNVGFLYVSAREFLGVFYRFSGGIFIGLCRNFLDPKVLKVRGIFQNWNHSINKTERICLAAQKGLQPWSCAVQNDVCKRRSPGELKNHSLTLALGYMNAQWARQEFLWASKTLRGGGITDNLNPRGQVQARSIRLQTTN